MLIPYELTKHVSEVSKGKVNKDYFEVFVSAMLAGSFIGLAYYASLVLNVESFGQNLFLVALIFSAGIIMVIITGVDLYTGNCLVMLGVFDKKIEFKKTVVHLLVVILGNFAGAFI